MNYSSAGAAPIVSKGRIAGMWAVDDAERFASLQRVRRCFALTKPWGEPPLVHQQSGRFADNLDLPENYQSIGSRGVLNMEGRWILGLFPPGTLWYAFALAAQVLYDPRIPDAIKQQQSQKLFLQELMLQALMEGASVRTPQRNRIGFRSAQRRSISQLIISGDSLEQITDDYRFKTFRRSQYVTARDGACDVMYHNIHERLDPLTLTPEQLIKAQLKIEDLQKVSCKERLADMFTYVEWQPITKKWTIQQECNGHIFSESDEPGYASPFICTALDLVSGQNYGRGLVEMLYGDLRSVDELDERLLDYAAASSRVHPILDQSSQMKDEDFLKRSGRVMRGARVQNGVWQDGTFLKLDKSNDMTVVERIRNTKAADLGKSFLLITDSAPQGEAGRTVYAWERTAQELEGALGGLYAPTAEDKQLPTLNRFIHMAVRDKYMQPLDRRFVEVRVLTGLSALSREQTKQKLLTFSQVLNSLGPPGQNSLRVPVFIAEYLKAESLWSPGMVKTMTEIAAEQQQAIQQQGQLAMLQEGAKAIGGGVQAALTAPIQPQKPAAA